MAIAVNVFRTFTQTVGTASSVFYTAPSGYTGVVLLSQVTNLGSQTHTVAIPASDTANLLSGKLVIESGDSLSILGSDATDLNFLSSILETSNL